MTVKVIYFAQLADLAGKSEEQITLHDPSPKLLYEKIQADYQFPHQFKQIQVAINHQLSSHEALLQDGDEIAFLPPMTGG